MWNNNKQYTSSNEPPPQPYVQAQVYNIPQSSIPTYPAVQPVQQNVGFWSSNQKNKPQSNSVGAASLIFVSGGMNMTWNIGFSIIPVAKHLVLSWFIGGIIGAIVGAFACRNVPKKILVGFSSILIVISGILQLSNPNSYDAILASRYINGIAVGVVFPMTFVLIGEEVVKPLRGMNAAGVDIVGFSSGIFIQIIYTALWSNDIENSFHLIQMSGILNIIYGTVAFIMGHFLIIESPVFYLERGDEQKAIDSLRRLQTPFTISYETYEQLEEHKLYLAENKERSFEQNVFYGIPALLKLCLYRSFMALGFSYIVNFAFTYSSIQTSPSLVYNYIFYAIARWIGPLIVSFTLDRKGRKPPMIVGFFVCAILAFTVGGIFDDKPNLIDDRYMNTVKYLLIFFQLFNSISMASSSAYLSEAFPLDVKPYYVAIVFIVEMLVHIIIIAVFAERFFVMNIFHISEYFLTLGFLMVVFLGVAVFVMPETKLDSLRQCLPKFRQLNNYRN